MQKINLTAEHNQKHAIQTIANNKQAKNQARTISQKVTEKPKQAHAKQ